MRLLSIIISALTLFILLVYCAAPATTTTTTSTVEQVRAYYLGELEAFYALVDKQLVPMIERRAPQDSLQRVFVEARMAYKRVEPIVDYFLPTTARHLNGAPIDEVETDEYEVNVPVGLQVMEEFLFPQLDTAAFHELLVQAKNTRGYITRAKTLWEAIGYTDAHIFDAMRLEIFRIITLGISGFDTPGTQNSMTEAAEALGAVANTLAIYEKTGKAGAELRSLQERIAKAREYLLQHPDFLSFDRLAFITEHANPISSAIVDLQPVLGIPFYTELRPLRATAKTLFEDSAFVADFYTISPDYHSTPAKIDLGEKLFYDASLSGDGSRSCAGCHKPELAFTDGLPRAEKLDRSGTIARNTPTLLNSGIQRAYFYDLRSTDLEHQAKDVVENTTEMHGNYEQTALLLAKDPEYLPLFIKAFPKDSGSVKPLHIQNAIAAYVRSLQSFNSRFDQYVRGDHQAMNAEEIQGFNLYMGKAKCGTCHFMPLFNGTIPPAFEKSEAEVLGTLASPGASNPKIDPDPGRYGLFDYITQFKFAFKTQTVRNVALTAPYMHNGQYRTLEQVMDFYNKGGAVGYGLALENQTLAPDPLGLTPNEVKAVIAFMNALTDNTAGKKASAAGLVTK
jgi:cytochrome c peroxidase